MPYTINRQGQNLPEPIQKNGITYVPMAAIINLLGGFVHWDNASKVANIEIGGKTASVQNGESNVDMIGNQVTMSGPAFIEDDKIWVPADFFERVLGFDVAVTGNTVGIGSHTARM